MGEREASATRASRLVMLMMGCGGEGGEVGAAPHTDRRVVPSGEELAVACRQGSHWPGVSCQTTRRLIGFWHLAPPIRGFRRVGSRMRLPLLYYFCLKRLQA